ncbi:MAG: RDD family protein [Acidobacteriota bacterium]
MGDPGPTDHPSTEPRGPTPPGGRIQCERCGFWNPDHEHRCGRCQHRLPRPDAGPYQQSLPLDLERPKVIPFKTMAAERVPPRPAAPAPRRSSTRTAPGRRTPPGQSSLDLTSPARYETAPPPAVYCDAPVAPPLLRSAALAVDGVFLGVGLALFGLAVYLIGGRIVLSLKTAPYLGGVVFALAVFYKVFFSVLGRDSAGLRCLGLRLINFDGQRPGVDQRLFRLVAACLSLAGLGAGLLWALLDREMLTWHDHISQTFLTTGEPDPPPVPLRRA